MKNTKIITSILNVGKKNILNDKKKLSEFNWDSMAMIGLISIIDEKYKKKITPKEIRVLKTISDLDNLITKKIK